MKTHPLLLLLALVGLLATACDPCARTKCQNGGSCDSGICYCPVGYEGTACETEWSAKFVGGSATVQAVNCGKTFSSDIQRVDNQTIKIYNLGGFSNATTCTREQTAVKAKLITNTDITIDDTFCTNFHLQGSGSFNRTTKQLTITYYCDFPGGNETCKAIYQY